MFSARPSAPSARRVDAIQADLAWASQRLMPQGRLLGVARSESPTLKGRIDAPGYIKAGLAPPYTEMSEERDGRRRVRSPRPRAATQVPSPHGA